MERRKFWFEEGPPFSLALVSLCSGRWFFVSQMSIKSEQRIEVSGLEKTVASGIVFRRP
jgi:hypothetical protein